MPRLRAGGVNMMIHLSTLTTWDVGITSPMYEHHTLILACTVESHLSGHLGPSSLIPRPSRVRCEGLGMRLEPKGCLDNRIVI